MNGESLAEAERAAIRALDAEFKHHGKLNMMAFDLINLAQSKIPESLIQEIPLPQVEDDVTLVVVKIDENLRESKIDH
jgi:hypothetical protein